MSESTQAQLAQMHDQQAQARARILRRPEVEQRTGLSRSAIYAAMAAGDFPKPLRLTAKAVGWLDSSIDSWISSRSAATAEA
jgi:prophage regulatory protein